MAFPRSRALPLRMYFRRAPLLLLAVAFSPAPARAQPALNEAVRGQAQPFQRAGVISPDLRWAASLDEAAVTLWDASTGQAVWRFPAPTRQPLTFPHRAPLAFSPDSRLLAVSPGSMSDVWVLQVPSGRLWRHFVHTKRGTLTGPGGERLSVSNFSVSSLAFSPDGSVLAAHAGQRVIAWQLASRDTVWIIWPIREGSAGQGGDTEMVHDLAFHPDGGTLAVMTGSGAWFYDAHTGAPTGRLPAAQDYPHALVLSPDGSLAATGGCHRMLIWSVAERRLLHTLDIPACVQQAAFSPDNRWVVAGTQVAGWRMWDVGTGQVVQTLYTPGDHAFSLAWRFSADGRRLMELSGGIVHRIRTWTLTPPGR